MAEKGLLVDVVCGSMSLKEEKDFCLLTGNGGFNSNLIARNKGKPILTELVQYKK